jgi:single-strand DNA-binding protein
MANFNKVLLIGNLTREPELRVTPGGLSICKFGLAVNRTFTDKEGNKREETTFVDIDAFGKQAEVISKYMSKGRAILVEGRLKLDQWESNTGEKRSKLGVVLEQFQFIGGRGEGGEGGGGYDSGSSGSESQAAPPRRAPSSAPAGQDDVDEDVPF